MMEAIADFPGAVARIQTMADGSPRITIDCPETVNKYLSLLAECQANGTYLHIVLYDADEFDTALKTGGKQV